MKVAELIKELEGYNKEKEIAATIMVQGKGKTTIYPYGVDVCYDRKVDKVEIITIIDADDEEGD